MSYLRSQVMTMKAPVPLEDKVSVRQFSEFTLFIKSLFLKSIIKNPYLYILISKLKGMKLK